MASNLVAMAGNGLQPNSGGPSSKSDGLPLREMASNLVAMASNPIAMASPLRAMASNLVAMASNPIAMASP